MSHGLSEEQCTAAFSQKHTMCLAGAGSGKTRTAVVRLNWLADYYDDPSCILALTFTRKAAGEMRERLFNMGSHPHLERLQLGTFHGWFSRYLRGIMRYRGFTIEGRDQNYTISDKTYQKRLIKGLMEKDSFTSLEGSDLYIDDSGKSKPDQFIDLYMSIKDKNWGKIELKSEAENYLMNMYEKSMRVSNSMDYTDLINISIRYLEANPDQRPTFKHIVVDEFQDTSDSQYRLLQLISEKATVFCVGDIDQSIYQWRGATPENVKRYIKEFNAELLLLSDNYRSVPSIVYGANALIENNQDRIEKVMNAMKEEGDSIRYFEPDDQSDQAQKVASEISRIQRDSPNETIGVLYRKNMSSMLIEKALVHVGVAYAVKKDVGFMNRREIQSIVSLLKTISNPRDTQSLILNMAHFVTGISMDKAIEINESLRAGFDFEVNRDIPPEECMCMGGNRLAYPVSIGVVKLNKPTQKRMGYFLQSINILQKAAQKPGNTGAIAEELIGEDWLKKLTKFSGDDPAKTLERQENVKELLKWSTEYKDLTEFLDSILLDIGAETEESNVSLMTIHGSKGLEFDHVYLIDASETNFTGMVSLPWEYEEARRLMYVAMTRARSTLTITNPKRVMSFGYRRNGARSVENLPCHFLWEIPSEYMPLRPSNEGEDHPFEHMIRNKNNSDTTERRMS